MPYHHGTRVSKAHQRMLAEYERHHGRVWVNQGRRTLAEQARFYAHYLRYGHPLAARPWPGAPHIKWGRSNHALDINDGVVDRVADFYRSKGVPVSFNVRGEPWHMDPTDNRALVRASRRYAGDPVIHPGAKGRRVLKLKKLMRARGLRDFRRGPIYGKGAQEAIKRLQRKHHLKPDAIVGERTWAALRK